MAAGGSAAGLKLRRSRMVGRRRTENHEALGPLAVFYTDRNRTADENTENPLGPPAVSAAATATAKEWTKKALGPLALHISLHLHCRRTDNESPRPAGDLL